MLFSDHHVFLTEPVLLGIIALVSSVLTNILLVVNTLITQRQSATIKALEKSTNGTQAALVHITGQAEYAKGLKQGENNSRI